MTIRQAFEILDLSPDASREDAQKAYRRLAKQYHPDKNSSPNASEIFRLVCSAKECIQTATDAAINQAFGRPNNSIDKKLDARFHTQMGIRKNTSGHYFEAIDEFDKALDPVCPNALNNRGKAYFALGYYNLAIKDFDEALYIIQHQS